MRGTRHPPTDKAEIINLVEQSHLSARQTLGKVSHGHQSLKNGMPLENYVLPGGIQAQISA